MGGEITQCPRVSTFFCTTYAAYTLLLCSYVSPWFILLPPKVATVEKLAQETQSQLAVRKRETFKIEEDANNMEKGKLDQDLLIDSLNEQIKQLEDKMSLLDAQVRVCGFSFFLLNVFFVFCFDGTL